MIIRDNLTVSEVYDLKLKLERDIANLVSDFYKQTGLQVSELDYSRDLIYYYGSDNNLSQLNPVTITIVL